MLLVIPCRPVGVQITGISCMCVELYSLCDIPVYRDTLVVSKPGIIFPIPPNFINNPVWLYHFILCWLYYDIEFNWWSLERVRATSS